MKDIYALIKKVRDEGLARDPTGGPGNHVYLLMADHLARTRHGNYSVDQVLMDLDTLIAAAEKAKEELQAAKAEADKS